MEDMSKHRLLAVVPLLSSEKTGTFEVYFATDEEVEETQEEKDEARNYGLCRSLGSDKFWMFGNEEVHFYAVRRVLLQTDSLFPPDHIPNSLDGIARGDVPWLSSPDGSYPNLQIYSGCKYETFVACVQFAGGQVFIPEHRRTSWGRQK